MRSRVASSTIPDSLSTSRSSSLGSRSGIAGGKRRSGLNYDVRAAGANGRDSFIRPSPVAHAMRAQTLLAVLGAALVLAGSVAADAGSVTLNPNASATLTTLSLKTGDVVDYQIASGFPVNFTIDRQGASDPIST